MPSSAMLGFGDAGFWILRCWIFGILDGEMLSSATCSLLPVTGTALLLLVAVVLTYFYFLEFKSRRKVEDQFHQTVIELENLNHSRNDRNWLLSGQSAINDSLQSLHELNSVTEAVLKALTQYLNLPAAGFYCYNESDKTLELNTAIAFPADSPRFYALGEGLVG